MNITLYKKLVFLPLLLVFFDVKCVYQSLFGIPCPGCGMTRAWLAALRLDWRAAFAYHPMFPFVPLILLYIAADGKVFKRRWMDITVLVLIGTGFLVLYLIRRITNVL